MSNPQPTNMNLPVKQGDDFVGELETMDLTELKGKEYFVGISTGDRSKPKYICTSMRGPFSFEEMCEGVGVMWQEHQHHAKVIVASKDFAAKAVYLDENTVDYIEAHFQDIITEAMLDGVFDDIKDFTCRAGLVEDDGKDNPMDGEVNAEKERNNAKLEIDDEDL